MPNIIQLSILSYDDFLDPIERESLGKSEVMSKSDINSSTGDSFTWARMWCRKTCKDVELAYVYLWAILELRSWETGSIKTLEEDRKMWIIYIM